MRYQLTENQIQVQMLMGIVLLPMVSLKVGRYPLNKIISQHLLASQFSYAERQHTIDGIKALVELGVFAQIGDDICITNISEGFLGVFDSFSSKTVEQVHEELEGAPSTRAVFDAIERDARLRSYATATRIEMKNGSQYDALQTPEIKPMSLGDKIAVVLLFLMLLSGLLTMLGY